MHKVHSVMHNVHSAITLDAQCAQCYNTQCHNTPYMYTLHAHLYSAITLHSQVHSVITLQLQCTQYSAQCTQCHNTRRAMYTVF